MAVSVSVHYSLTSSVRSWLWQHTILSGAKVTFDGQLRWTMYVWLVALPIVVLVSIAWWRTQRQHALEFQRSMRLSSAACVPGILLWLQCAAAHVQLALGGSPQPAYYWVTTVLTLFSAPALPFVFLVAVLKRPMRDAPRWTNLVQLSQFVSACLAVWLSLYFAAGI